MRLIRIYKNVESGQCKGALLRIQFRTTAIFILADTFRGFAGSHIGLFAPNGYGDKGYRFTRFYFRPWFAPDIAVCRLPKWYRKLASIFSFNIY